ncbi:hypothetical protein TWF569_007429, partial [Orbilia oligospora]
MQSEPCITPHIRQKLRFIDKRVSGQCAGLKDTNLGQVFEVERPAHIFRFFPTNSFLSHSIHISLLSFRPLHLFLHSHYPSYTPSPLLILSCSGTMKTVLAHGLVASRSILSNGLDLAGVTEFSRAQVCCLALKGISAKAVSFSGSSTYTNETHNYFSAANIVQPACVFSPETAEHVAYAIRIFNSANCSFSVRSGGHLPIPGSNGQNGAILLATTKLKTVDVRGKTARIGPGNTWTEVYRETDKVGKVVLGGRIGTVGVGGLVLGGGISFQGSEHGFVCDTVVNYQ